MAWAMSPPEWWPGKYLGSEVLSDFDVLWAENYNKRRQMVWSMRIHYNEIDKVTGKIRQICQGGRIRNNSRNVGSEMSLGMDFASKDHIHSLWIK